MDRKFIEQRLNQALKEILLCPDYAERETLLNQLDTKENAAEVGTEGGDFFEKVSGYYLGEVHPTKRGSYAKV